MGLAEVSLRCIGAGFSDELSAGSLCMGACGVVALGIGLAESSWCCIGAAFFDGLSVGFLCIGVLGVVALGMGLADESSERFLRIGACDFFAVLEGRPEISLRCMSAGLSGEASAGFL